MAIGVSQADPLPYLAGAVNGAKSFAEWATAAGYETRLLIDDEAPVTIGKLQDELNDALAAGGVERLVLYFAGHGVLKDMDEGFWLLSDWDAASRAVDSERLRRRLGSFDVGQVTMIADACRTLPRSTGEQDLTPDPILGKGHSPDNKTMSVDKFIAAQDGAATYTIPGDTPERDRCLFSGMLLEALWGARPEAFSKFRVDVVTGLSLKAFLQDTVPAMAQLYKVELYPSVQPTFNEGEDVYLIRGGLPAKMFDPWPDASKLLGMGTTNGGGHEAHDHVGDEAAEPEEVDAAPPPPGADVGVGPDAVGDPGTPAMRPDFAAPASLHDRLLAQERPTHFETGAGFAFEPAEIGALWTPHAVKAETAGRRDWWRLYHLNAAGLQQAEAVMFELGDGSMGTAAALPFFVGSVLIGGPDGRRGVEALVYREIGVPDEASMPAVDTLALFESSSLVASEQVRIAEQLRLDKFADPVRGVVSAYLYESVGDIDSVRRLASLFCEYGQPIPFDIALIAELEAERREDGLLWAHVPAVAERKARPGEEPVSWAYQSTGAAAGPVAGWWPWMRQGWTLLDDFAEGRPPLVLDAVADSLGEILERGGLRPSAFTTFDGAVGRRLAERLGMRRTQPD